jgi:hypothetical protein
MMLMLMTLLETCLLLLHFVLLQLLALVRVSRLSRAGNEAARPPIAETMEEAAQEEHVAGTPEAEPPRTVTRTAAARTRIPAPSPKPSHWRGRIAIGTGNSGRIRMGQARFRVRGGDLVQTPLGEIAIPADPITATTTATKTATVTASSAGTDAAVRLPAMAGCPSEWAGLPSGLGCRDGRMVRKIAPGIVTLMEGCVEPFSSVVEWLWLEGESGALPSIGS